MTAFSARIDYSDFNRIAPSVRSALVSLGQAAVDAGLEKDLVELIKLRASQINGCAFCLQFHLNIARGLGLAQAKLDQLAAWRDAAVYSERERAALAWTERLTCIADTHIDENAYQAARAHFSEHELVHLSAAIAAINGWNRLAVAFRFVPPASAQ